MDYNQRCNYTGFVYLRILEGNALNNGNSLSGTSVIKSCKFFDSSVNRYARYKVAFAAYAQSANILKICINFDYISKTVNKFI